jgi:hypothetical protein
MIGETLPRECSFISMFAVNFNVTSTTIPINTKYSDAASPGTDWGRTSGYKSKHGSGVTVGMGDGSIHFMTENIDYRLYNNLGTRAGGEVATLP